MHIIRNRGGALFSGLMLVLAAFIAPLSSTLPAYAKSPKAGEHLITIHDRGLERSVISKQSTLRNVFKEIGLLTDPNDIVEPGLDTHLDGTTYQVNVYRARPVTVVDGTYQTRIMTAYQTPKQIAKAANITLHDEDQETLSVSNDLVADGASVMMTIKRALPVQLVLYGTPEQVYTQAKTVGQFMQEKKLKLAPEDGMNLDEKAAITSNMTISIWRDGVQTQTRNEDIPFTTREVQDSNQPVGYRNVTTAGVNGKKAVTYQVNIRNGQEISRQALQSVVLNQPSEEVVVVGTKVSLPAGSHEDWMAAAGISAGDYGYVNYIVMHEGGWEPCKVQGGSINCSYSGSMGYGIVQATPGSKMVSAGADWRTNPITQLKWATGYANGRYGGWANAYNHWRSSHNW